MSYEETDSHFVQHEPCPSCGSQNNLARYSDGHASCFSQGCSHYEHADGEVKEQKRGKRVSGLIEGEVRYLAKRKISEETCDKFKYMVGEYKGKPVQIANFFNGSKLVAQKGRTKNKDFFWKGEPKKAGLFGQHLWRDGGKRIVITEGEIDCMTISQLQGNKWPVISVTKGSKGAKKELAAHIEWLEKFEDIILCFDMDEPGQDAAEECATIFTPGKVKIAQLPLKDANEMHLQGRGKEVIDALWGAKDYRPPMVAGVMDVFDEAVAMPTYGISWPWPSLDALTYGIQRKKCYYLGAGVGIGKTNWAKELQSWLVNKHGLPVGVFMLEETPGRTLKGIAGKFTGIPFHKPDAMFEESDLHDAIKGLDGKVFLYRHDKWGADWDSIKPAIRAMVHYGGVKDIFLDNLTVLVSHLSASEANDEINRIAKDISHMVHELDITLYGFSHLNAPATGEPHERGGKVHERQFTGSRALMRYANYILGIERNKDPEISQKERNTSTLVLLKDREFGNVGRFPIYYDPDTDGYREPPPGFLDDINDDDEGDTFDGDY